MSHRGSSIDGFVYGAGQAPYRARPRVTVDEAADVLDEVGTVGLARWRDAVDLGMHASTWWVTAWTAAGVTAGVVEVGLPTVTVGAILVGWGCVPVARLVRLCTAR